MNVCSITLTYEKDQAITLIYDKEKDDIIIDRSTLSVPLTKKFLIEIFDIALYAFTPVKTEK